MTSSCAWTLSIGFALAVTALSVEPARAGYEDEQNDSKLGVIERAFDAFVLDPAIFDGASFRPGVTASTAVTHTNLCYRGPQAYQSGINGVTAKGKASERARKLAARYNAQAPLCIKMRAAAQPLIDGAASADAAAKGAARDSAAMQVVCQKLIGEASDAVGGRMDLMRTMDTWAGNRTPATAEHIKEFRTRLEKLAPVCAQPRYAEVSKCRQGDWATFQGEGGAEYNRADICVAAADPSKTLTAVATRTLERDIDRKTAMPTIESFRADEGWIKVEGEVRYATFFQVSDAAKAERTAKARELYAAAGVPTPADLSALWATEQARLDALKTAVDATAGEWTLTGGTCKGYPCAMAEKAVKNAPGKPRVKQVTAEPWKVVSRPGEHAYRYMAMHILYQVPGEPYCQLTSATANEMYTGGSKFVKASKLQWGYVRFQKCS